MQEAMMHPALTNESGYSALRCNGVRNPLSDYLSIRIEKLEARLSPHALEEWTRWKRPLSISPLSFKKSKIEITDLAIAEELLFIIHLKGIAEEAEDLLEISNGLSSLLRKIGVKKNV